jgi:hypothetical protein
MKRAKNGSIEGGKMKGRPPKRWKKSSLELKGSARDMSTTVDKIGLRVAMLMDLDASVLEAAEQHARTIFRGFRLHYHGEPTVSRPAKQHRAEAEAWISQHYFVTDNDKYPSSPGGFALPQRFCPGTKSNREILPEVMRGLKVWFDFLADPKVRLVFDGDLGFGMKTRRRIKPGCTVLRGWESLLHSQAKYETSRHGTTCGPSRFVNAACGVHANALFSSSFNVVSKSAGIPADRPVYCCYRQLNETWKCPVCGCTMD